MTDQRDVSISAEVWEQVLSAMKDLLREPLPPYSTLSLQLVVHAGIIRRIKTTREVQKEVSHIEKKNVYQ